MSEITFIGQPSTIGELKKIISQFDDDTSFGFRNQPMQDLVVVKDGYNLFVVFNQTRPPLTKEILLEAQKRLNELTIPIQPKINLKCALISYNGEHKEICISGNEDTLIKYCQQNDYTWEYLSFGLL